MIFKISPNIQKEDGKRLLTETCIQNTEQLLLFFEMLTNLATNCFLNFCPEHSTFGFTVSTDQVSNQAYISKLKSSFKNVLSKNSRIKI